MQLADLIDLESLLHDGEAAAGDVPAVRQTLEARGVPPATARARVEKERELREELCLAWLASERPLRPDLPGRRVASALRTAGLVLVVVGLLVGVSSARVLLAYDGRQPVNVLYFVAVMFVAQIVLLVFMLWFVLRAGRSTADAEHGVAHRAIAWLIGRFVGKDTRSVAAGLSQVRARRALYSDVERWTLFALAQRFGLAFNVGALATCVFLVAFSDLVFSWATTLEVGADDLHAAVRVLALPWTWFEAAVPSQDVIAASRWDRMTGTFVGGQPLDAALRLSEQWWRFLVAGVCAYGLVPRAAALAFGSWRARRALRRVPLDHAGFQRLFDRILPSSVGWEGPDADAVRGAPPVAGGVGPATAHAPSEPGAPAWVVAWGRLGARSRPVGELVARRFSADVRGARPAGGASLDADRAAVEALRDARAERVVLVCDSGQQPSKDVVRFVRRVREAIGDRKPIIVGAVDERDDGSFSDPGDDIHEAWRRALATNGDAYLWVERLGGAE